MSSGNWCVRTECWRSTFTWGTHSLTLLDIFIRLFPKAEGMLLFNMGCGIFPPLDICDKFLHRIRPNDHAHKGEIFGYRRNHLWPWSSKTLTHPDRGPFQGSGFINPSLPSTEPGSKQERACAKHLAAPHCAAYFVEGGTTNTAQHKNRQTNK